MRIELTQDKYAQIDDADYQLVADHGWFAHFDGKRWYAMAHMTKKKIVYMHRVLLPSAKVVDHINGDGLDNRRANIRACTQSQNLANQKIKPHSSRFKGVSFDKKLKKWTAYCKVNGKTTYIGGFKVEEDAARAYNAKAKELYGEFARLNPV